MLRIVPVKLFRPALNRPGGAVVTGQMAALLRFKGTGAAIRADSNGAIDPASGFDHYIFRARLADGWQVSIKIFARIDKTSWL